MRAPGPLAQVWSDLADLFSHEDRRFWFLFVAAILLQAGFWYLASPGPRLLDFEPRLPENAVRSVLWVVALFLAMPFLLGRMLGFRPRDARANFGRAATGVPVVLVTAGALVPLLFLATTQRAVQFAYPWPGAWTGASAGNFALWSGIYLLYFVAFEYFYRGFLFRLLEEKWGILAGLWIQALAATLITLGRPLPEVLISLPGGLLLGVLVIRSRFAPLPDCAALVDRHERRCFLALPSEPPLSLGRTRAFTRIYGDRVFLIVVPEIARTARFIQAGR